MQKRSKSGIALIVLGAVYLYGAVLGGISWFWDSIWKGHGPSLSWWQYLVAPLCIGTMAMMIEWLTDQLQRITGFGAPGHPRFRRNLELLILCAGLGVIIIGPALYFIAHQ